MPTVRRRLLNLLSKTGLTVRDVGPGAALLARRGDYTVTTVTPKSWLVTRGKDKAAAKAAAVAADLPSGKPRTVPLGTGARLVLDEGQVAAGELQFQKAAANYLAHRHVAALLKHYRANCVIDVGANVGQYAKQLRKFGYTGRIVSFEPVPHIVEKLREAARNDPDWWVFPHALGQEESCVTMNVVKGSMSSILGPSEFGNTRYKRFKNIRQEEVQVRRLDGLLDKILDGIDDPRPYLKLDTQGYDMEAFGGTGDRIQDFVGMQSEVALMQIYEGMPRMNEAIAAYEEAGFEVTGMFPVTREETTGRVLEFDCVMMRASALPEDA